MFSVGPDEVIIDGARPKTENRIEYRPRTVFLPNDLIFFDLKPIYVGNCYELMDLETRVWAPTTPIFDPSGKQYGTPKNERMRKNV